MEAQQPSGIELGTVGARQGEYLDMQTAWDGIHLKGDGSACSAFAPYIPSLATSSTALATSPRLAAPPPATETSTPISPANPRHTTQPQTQSAPSSPQPTTLPFTHSEPSSTQHTTQPQSHIHSKPSSSCFQTLLGHFAVPHRPPEL